MNVPDFLNEYRVITNYLNFLNLEPVVCFILDKSGISISLNLDKIFKNRMYIGRKKLD